MRHVGTGRCGVSGCCKPALFLFIAFVACLEQPADLKPTIELLVATQGHAQQQAIHTLCQHGRSALPAIEALFHRPDPKARRAAFLALRQLDLTETAPLLGHLAQFDQDPDIREQARTLLEHWAASPGAKGQAAKRALVTAESP